ncbi:MAG: flavodoxin family protein [Clostridia bacterium]
MKAFLLNGSPRTDGSSAAMLDLLEDLLQERGFVVEGYSALELLREMDEPFCTHCSSVCDGRCYDGTAVEEFYRQLPQVDCLVLASPVYFGTVSAEIKALWDFGRKIRSERGLLYTVGAALAVGGGRFGGQETTIRALHDMMLIQGMIVVGDSSGDGIGHQGVAAQSRAAGEAAVADRLKILADALDGVSHSTADLRAAERAKDQGGSDK